MENYGLIFLDPTNNDNFVVRSPIIISSQMYNDHMRIVNEPILSLSDDLDVDANEKQDLCTIVNRLYYYQDPSTKEVDLFDVFPTLFERGHVVRISEKKISIRKLTNRIQSLAEAEKLENETGYLNFPKASWAIQF